MDPDRRAEEPEGLTKAILQEPLVREMEAGGDVREEHERGWCDTSLCGVEDPYLVAAWTGGRVLGDHVGHEPVELGGRDPLAARRRDLVDHLQQPRCPLAGPRRDVHHRRPLEELQLPAYRGVELFR